MYESENMHQNQQRAHQDKILAESLLFLLHELKKEKISIAIKAIFSFDNNFILLFCI
jgi:hypothetical protein